MLSEKNIEIKGGRLAIILKNVLNDICEKVEIPQEQYIPWLKEEIGVTEEELNILKEINCLPTPE